MKGAPDKVTASGFRGRRKWAAAGGGALAMLFLAILVLNVTTGEKNIRGPLAGHYGVHDPQFQRTMGVLFGAPLADGNSTEDFQNGDAIFPAMLADIRGAEQSICLESYIYWSGSVGEEFSEAGPDVGVTRGRGVQ